MLSVLAFAFAVQTPPRVVASRRELRFELTEPAGQRWAWSAEPDSVYFAGFSWSVMFETGDGPRWLDLTARRGDDRAHEFRSLSALVAQLKPELCEPDMIRRCTLVNGDASTRETRDGTQLTITLRDSATIARLLGARPERVEVRWFHPGPYTPSSDSVRVEYVDPRLPNLTAADREAWAAARARHERGSVSYRIEGGRVVDGEIRLAVGEVAHLYVSETHCHADACSGHNTTFVAGWATDDSSVARIAAPQRSEIRNGAMVIYGDERMELTGLRPGVTTLRVPLPEGEKLQARVRVAPR